MAKPKRKSTKRSGPGAKKSKTKRSRKKKATSKSQRQSVPARPRSSARALPAAAADPALDNLQKIDKIVVLIMENRSFDHMLGYLRLEGNRNDVEGLTPGLKERFRLQVAAMTTKPLTAETSPTQAARLVHGTDVSLSPRSTPPSDEPAATQPPCGRRQP